VGRLGASYSVTGSWDGGRYPVCLSFNWPAVVSINPSRRRSIYLTSGSSIESPGQVHSLSARSCKGRQSLSLCPCHMLSLAKVKQSLGVLYEIMWLRTLFASGSSDFTQFLYATPVSRKWSWHNLHRRTHALNYNWHRDLLRQKSTPSQSDNLASSNGGLSTSRHVLL